MLKGPPGAGTLAWLHRSRVGVAALVLGVALLIDSGDPEPGRAGALLGLGVALGVMTIVYEFLSRRKLVDPSRLIMAEMVVDVAVSALIVSLTGGPLGQFVLLFPLAAFVAGTLLGLRGGAVIGVLSAVAFGVIIAFSPDISLPEAGGALFALEKSSQALFYPMFFVAVGILSGLLGTRMVESERALARAAHEMEMLRLDTESIVQNLSSALLTIDRSARIVHFNRVAEGLLGRRASAVRGRLLARAFDEGCRELVDKIENSLSEGIFHLRAEVRITPPGGDEPIPVGISTSLLKDLNGETTGVVALFQDLSEVRRLEQASRRQDRLSVIGGMAASIAHEVRNCVNPISGSVELLREELNLTGENAKLLDLIGREAGQMERFVSELLNFTRGNPIHLQETDLRVMLENTLEKIRRHPTYRTTVSLNTNYSAQPAVVNADPEQLEQVFFNLGLNALEAMGPVGRLTITVAAPTADDPECRVEFADTGAGISREKLDRIFEPFYTTKGSGTGLGLAIAHRIVERHEGRMEVKSHPGSGTRVCVYLPGAGVIEADADRLAAEAS